MGVHKREIAEGDVTGEAERERSGDAGFEDGRRGPEPRTAAVEAGQDRERDFPLEPKEEASSANTLVFGFDPLKVFHSLRSKTVR